VKSIILQAAAQILVALLLLFSAFMLFRGHNVPGGGFIGGLIGATGFIVHAIACGPAQARAALRVAPENIAMAGLTLALLAGVFPLLTGDDLLTGKWLFLGAAEGAKGLPVSNVIAFDIGVYFVVLGSVLSLVFALEEET
jgi:multicomponent Na+:H+ antiporter subunit B